MISKESLIRDLNAVRSQSPLVQNITNYVAMNTTANALLAVGASPVMAHAVEEVVDMANIASSLVINIGTLSKNWVDAMIKAGKAAQEKDIPVIFDPVGAGATAYRTETSLQIISECHPTVIRGNASEITSLVEERGIQKELTVLLLQNLLFIMHNFLPKIQGLLLLSVVRSIISSIVNRLLKSGMAHP